MTIPKPFYAILAMALVAALIVVVVAVYGAKGRVLLDTLMMLLSALVMAVLGWVKLPAGTPAKPAEPPAIDDT